MEKNPLFHSSWLRRKINVIFLAMKLLTLLIFTGSMALSASTYSQRTKIDLKFENSSLTEILNSIEKTSEFIFIYNQNVVNSDLKRTIIVKDENIEKVLCLLFEGADISFRIDDRQVFLYKRDELKNPELINQGNNIQQQQKREISGAVKDAKGITLPGVSVVVKGTTIGTVTDSDEKFNLSVPLDAKTLTFSFVGMKTQETAIGTKTTISLVLEEATTALDEVVAVGYGTMKKMDLTGSIASVSAKNLKNHPMNDFSQALQGRVSGVSVTNTSGAPGQNAKIRIRGANSLSGGNDPLIIIDGIPSAYDVNINDIKSVEILKDASATAIYGSRGANGVILITTMRGDPSAPKIILSSNIGMSQVRKKYDLLDPASYAELANKTTGIQQYTAEQITGFRTNGGTDWQDEIFRNGLSQNHQATVSGGASNVRYLFSGNYINETGTLINTNRDKYSVRANIDADFGKRLTIGMDIVATMNKKFNPNLGSGGTKDNPIYQSILFSPTVPVYKPDGTYNIYETVGALGRNPVLLAKEPYDLSKGKSIGINTNLKYKILDGFTFNGIASINSSTSTSKGFTNNILATTTSLSLSSSDALSWQVEALLNYEKKFLKWHSFSATAGFEAFARESRSMSGSKKAVDNPGSNLSLGTTPAISQGYSYAALQSFFGRINYNYKSKYYLTATYRADGSSKFRDKNKFGYFPSFGLSWVASEEEFIKNLEIFDRLKFRGSWGITGNQAISSYATFSTIGTGTYTFTTTTKYPGTWPGSPANTNLRWEETEQKDIGMDLSFFKNRLNITMDYYQKETTGLLLKKALPSYDGGFNVTQNLGQINNKGFEFSADCQIINKKEFGWNLMVNISTLKNRVVSLGGETQIFGGSYGSGVMNTNAFIVKPGEPLGSFWGYKYLGIWSQGETAEALKYGNQPGDSKYEDLNKDNLLNSSDYQIIGNANPSYTVGLSNSLTYKNFEFNLLVESVQGRDVYNIMYASAAVVIPDSRTITLKEGADIWSASNLNAKFPAVSTTNKNFMSSSRWLQDGSYVKVRNISFSYIFPKHVSKFADIKLTLSAQNFITLTKYKGFDPEVTSSLSSDIDSGIDFGVYPTSKIITTGLTVTF